MKKNIAVKRELRCTYGIDIALCVFNFLICTTLCWGGAPWLNIAGVVAFVTALLPLTVKRMYYRDEVNPKSVKVIMAVYRAAQVMLMMYGIDYFLIAGVI